MVVALGLDWEMAALGVGTRFDRLKVEEDIMFPLCLFVFFFFRFIIVVYGEEFQSNKCV